MKFFNGNSVFQFAKLFTVILFLASTAAFAQPVISSFVPTSGPVGTAVTITGTGFNATATQNVVLFGATRATVTSATATELVVAAPLGSTYQNITVANLATGLVGGSPKPFIATFDGRVAYAGQREFSVGPQPKEAIISDFDNDGKPDLAVSNGSGGIVSILRNNSNPGALDFAPKSDFPAGSSPRALSAADVDGDGLPDLIVANFTNTISILRNTSTTGAVNFAVKVDLFTGTSNESVGVRDFDADGKAEIAVANPTGNAFSVFRNRSTPGAIDFASKIDFVTGNSPRSVAIGDMDGDGRSDLAVANSGSNSVSVFRNVSVVGVVDFSARVDYVTGTNPRALALGDLEDDGKLDLVVANGLSSSISVFKNTSVTGTVEFAARVDFSSNIYPEDVSIGEVDGDGKPDVVVGNPYSEGTGVSVFRNTSSAGAIGLAAKFDFFAGGSPGSVKIGDLDMDSKADLLTLSDKVAIMTQLSLPPVIAGFSPAFGPVGATVTITGTGFNPTPAQNAVFFGATRATVTSATSTGITLTVPKGSTQQPISATNLATNLTGYSNKPFLLTHNGNVAFGPGADVATGEGPNAVECGDLDGDGKPDLITANRFGGSISLIRNTSNTGNVSFSSKLDLPTGTGPLAVNVADLDGDGKLDLAVANSDFANVSIYRNDSGPGVLNFIDRLDLPFGIGYPTFVATGDLDSDGRPDLVVTWDGFGISVFRNISELGEIRFAPRYNLVSEPGPYCVKVADFDGDNRVDLAVANLGADNISIFRNLSSLGMFSFAPRVDFPAGNLPVSLEVGDLDADGKPDLAVANINGNGLSLFRNTSATASITFAEKNDFETGFSAFSVRMADVDGDAKLDLVVANSSSSSVSVFRNLSSSGSLTLVPRIDIAAGNSPTATAIADFDGDLKPDLAISNLANNKVSVFRQILPPPKITSFTPTSGPVGTNVTITGTGFNITPSNNVVIFGATRASVTAATATQLTVTVPTGATFAPITVLNTATGLLAYSQRNFTLTFSPTKGTITAADFSPKVDLGTLNIPTSVLMGDLDGDGKTDLAVTNQNSPTVSVFRNVGSPGSVNYATKVDFAAGDSPSSVAMGDLDGDGKIDLAVVNNQAVSVLKNTGSVGSVSFAAKVDFTTGISPYSVSIRDFDGDGKADIAVLNYNSNTVSIFRNTSSVGSVSFAAKTDFATGLGPRSLVIGDLDGDDKPDLAVANLNDNTVSVFRNTSSAGNVSFAAKVDFAAGTSPFSIAIGDLDGDGKADLAVANEGDNTVSVFRNTSTIGSLSCATKVDFINGAHQRSVVLGDLDGDGKAEIAVANRDNNTVSVFRNTGGTGSVSFATKVDLVTGIGPVSVSIGDLDGDGKADLAVANSSSNTVSVIRSNPVFPPTITSFTPTSASQGSSITITGTSLAGATGVSFGGTAAASYNVVSATTINAVVGAGTSGDVTVTTPNGTVALTGFNFLSNQTITFNSLPVKAFGDAPFSLAATASSGLPVSYSSSNTAVAAISGNSLTIVGVGSADITARQPGNASFNPAADVVRPLTVEKGSQSISFTSAAPSNATVGGATYTPTATSTSGLPVTFTLSPSSAGIATISGGIVTFIGVGSVTIQADQAGNNEFNAASTAIQTFSVSLSPPVANAATLISQTSFTANWNAVAAATSYRLDVSADDFASFVPGFIDKTITATGDAVTGLAVSTAYKYRVRAVNDNGTSVNSNVIDVTTLAKQDQTITFAAPTDRTVGDAAFTLSATASSALAVSFESLTTGKVTVSGNTVTIVAPGTATIRAKQEGNANFNAAPNVDRTFCIRPAKPTITLTNANTETPTLTSSATAGNQWFLNGTAIAGATNATLTVTQAGVYTVRSTIETCASELSNAQAIIVTGDIASGTDALRVYPNPASDRVYVSLKSFARGREVQLRLVDMNGKVLQKQIGQGGETVELSMAGYAEGAYLVTAEQGRLREQVKIVKE